MTWRIGFLGRKRDSAPWLRLLHPSYAHCWAARRLWHGSWFWLEWTPGGLLAGVVSSATVRQASLATSETLIFKSTPMPPVRRPVLAVHSCASIVAHAVGVRIPFATPWRLARALRQRGGRPLMRP